MYSQEFKFDHPMVRDARTLQEVLQHRSRAVRAEVEKEVRGVLDAHADESVYINSVVSRFLVKIPRFDFDPGHIQKVEEYDQVSSPHQGIFPNQTMSVWVVNFGFPYEGGIEYLRYIPTAGSTLSFPQFTYDGEYMWFKVWTPDSPEKDIQKIKTEKENAIAFLQKRIIDAIPEIEAFNQQLQMAVQQLFESLKQKYQKDKDYLSLL